MAIWKDARILWDGNNLSSSCRSAAVELGAEDADATAMGAKFRQQAGGTLKTAAIAAEFNWAAGSTTSVDSLFGSTGKLGQTGALTIRPTTAGISATNPEYSGTFKISGYSFGGSVGDQHVASVNFTAAGDITRATST